MLRAVSPPQALGPTSSPTFTGLTLSGMTAGSVLFAGTAGVVSQDNANLKWDTATTALKLNDIYLKRSGTQILEVNDGTNIFMQVKPATGVYQTGQYPIIFPGGSSQAGGFAMNVGSMIIRVPSTSQILLGATSGVNNIVLTANGTAASAVAYMTGKMSFGGVQAPTHAVTIDQAQAATAFASYNTSDQVTNFERFVGVWSSNIFGFTTQQGGTGVMRDVRYGANAGGGAPNNYMQVAGNGATNGYGLKLFAVGVGNITPFTGVDTSGIGLNGSSVTQIGFAVNPVVVQTVTGGYTALDVNPTETTVGSGNKFLQTWRVGSAQKAFVDNTGQAMFGTSSTTPRATLNSAASFATGVATTVTGNVTLSSSHCVVPVDATAGNVTVTLPSAASSATGNGPGRMYTIKKVDASANSVIIDGNASETIDGALTKTTTARWATMTIQCNGTEWFVTSVDGVFT